MLRKLITSVAAATVLMTPLLGHAAETFKLRPALVVTEDENQKQLSQPTGVACNDKSIVVADTGNGRLVLYSFQEKTLRGGTEIKVPQLPYPIQVQFAPNGSILALDGKLHKVAQFSSTGGYISYLSLQGVPEPSTVAIRSFKIDPAGNLYILDLQGERVLVTDPTGKYLSQIPTPQAKGFFSDVALKPNGDLLLLDSVAATVYISRKSAAGYAPFEVLAKDLGKVLTFADYLTTDSKGTAYLVDHNGSAIVALSPDGAFVGRQLNMGWKSGTIYYPAQICLTPTGEIFVADRGNSIVQAFEFFK